MAQKTNPKKIPATMADVKKAYKQGIDKGVSDAFAIILIALLDGGIIDREQVGEMSDRIFSAAESIKKKYAKTEDFKQVLKTEYDLGEFWKGTSK